LQAGGGERADDLGQVAQVHHLPECRAGFVMRATQLGGGLFGG
jgi:hypothetical protein